MAKGSHATWGGWETRQCWKCGRRIRTSDTGAHHYENGTAFSLCAEHITCYSEAREALLEQPDADHADNIHPDQLTLQ